MGKRFLASYPSVNNVNYNIENMYSGIVEALLLKFSPLKFGTVIIDSKTSVPNIYCTDETGYKLGKKYEEGEPKKPIIRFEFNTHANNMEDTQLGIYNLKRMANAYGFNAELRGYAPFYEDIFGVRFLYSSVHTKTDVNIGIVVSSRDDQLAMANIIDTNIDQRYGIMFSHIPIFFSLPNDMIRAYSEALFKNELDYARSPDSNKDESEKIFEGLRKIINEKLYKYSNEHIVYKEYNNNRIINYNLLVFRDIYLKLDRFQIDEGEKRGEVYIRYGLSSSGSLEFQSIMNFLIDFPSVVNGNFIDKNMFNISFNGMENDYVKMFAERYVETREADNRLNFREKDLYKCLHDEQDILLDCSETEVINFFEDYVPKDEIALKFSLICDNVPKEELKNHIHFVIHRNNTLLYEEEDYIFKDTFVIKILNPVREFPYHVKLLIDWFYFASKWEQIKRIVKRKSMDNHIPLENFSILDFNPFSIEDKENLRNITKVIKNKMIYNNKIILKDVKIKEE